MKLKFGPSKKPGIIYILFFGVIIGIIITFSFNYSVDYTSTDVFCASCHVHPHVFESRKKTSHYDNSAGMQVQCIECHLPPKGQGHLREKIRLGAKDIYGFLFKDHSKIIWDEKRQLEFAVHFTYESACIKCHQNLFPLSLSQEGGEAHLYYRNNIGKVKCLNCHLDVGHYMPAYKSTELTALSTIADSVIYSEPAEIDSFADFTEYIPDSNLSFEMKAIPGGVFKMGSPANEPYRKPDEGPQVEVKISPFFMAEHEVTWNEFMNFYLRTTKEGRSTDVDREQDVDGITGPTPPYGSPDRNWGFGKRPAISIRFHAAQTYCEWLSQITGKTYRLPTEAEWEYACRAGTTEPYFFEGNPKKIDNDRFINRLFGADTSLINRYVIYSLNSGSKSQTPDMVEPNPFGLINMAGNVAEFCSDWYAADVFEQYTKKYSVSVIENPVGPESGTERVIRGGSYRSNPGDIRSASRDYTRTDEWMISDPQSPKSEWWYSDCFYVGFRVVCEYDEKKQ